MKKVLRSNEITAHVWQAAAKLSSIGKDERIDPGNHTK